MSIGMVRNGVLALLLSTANLIALDTHADPAVYDAVLSALGKPGPAWAVRLDELEKSLIATGTAPSEARTAIMTVVRDAGVPTGWEIQILLISRDIGAVMGTGLMSETRLLTQSISSGFQAMREYALSRGLEASDVAQIRNYLLGGAKAEAMDFILKRLQSRFEGKYELLREIK